MNPADVPTAPMAADADGGDALHKFLFDGLPVRGALVRLTGSWRALLSRRSGERAFPPPVRGLLGEMAAAGCLMQSNIQFNGALVLQAFGDGPVPLAVVEVQPEFSYRATATVTGEVPADARLEAMLNVHGKGRCAITLDPRDRLPGQQPYQGVVALHGDRGEPLQAVSQVLEHYMLQSEQLDTRLVLAANDDVAAGLLIQRLPIEGAGNLAGTPWKAGREDDLGRDEDFNRIAMLAASLTRDELLSLDAPTLLHRLFWNEPLRVYVPAAVSFACSCSRERVRSMLRALGAEEVDSILAEQGQIDVGCEFCGQPYRFDRVDAAELLTADRDQPPGSSTIQ